MSGFILSGEAKDDLWDIWNYISDQSIDAADRVREEIYDAIVRLVKMPGLGHRREDLIEDSRLLFWSVRHYLIIYQAGTDPLEIVRIISGYRDVGEILRDSVN